MVIMLNKLKFLFQDRCPDCEQKLISRQEDMATIKHCPDHHYTEEIYNQLGVTIVYHPSKDNR
jgi:hypothetical protein